MLPSDFTTTSLGRFSLQPAIAVGDDGDAAVSLFAIDAPTEVVAHDEPP